MIYMKVKELIEKLNKLPKDAEVVNGRSMNSVTDLYKSKNNRTKEEIVIIE